MLGKGTFYVFKKPEAEHEWQEQASTAEAQVKQHPETGEPYCLSAIVEATRAQDWNVRSHAVMTLGRLKDVEGIPALAEALRDRHRQVRAQAQAAFEHLDTPSTPILVQVLLAEGLSANKKAEIITAVMKFYRPMHRGLADSSAEAYCRDIAEQEMAEGLSDEEAEALACLKESAKEVFEALLLQKERDVLLRGSSEDHTNAHNELLRSTLSPPGHEPETLLRPTAQDSVDED